MTPAAATEIAGCTAHPADLALERWQRRWDRYIAHLKVCLDCVAEHCAEGQSFHDDAEAARTRLAWMNGGAL